MGNMQEAKFVLSRKKVLEQYNKIKNLCDVVSYSSKTNQEITKILEESTNCMFSLHMANELKHVKNKSRVIFLAQGWNQEEIQNLVSEGINSFIVDNERDLDELLIFLEQNQVEVDLLLRIKFKENTIRTERYFVFGMNSEVVNKRIRELRDNKKIKNLGIHFHRKTQNMSEWNLKYDFENVINGEVIDLLDFVNIGGGIPSEYANTNVDVLQVIFNKIKEFRTWLSESGIRMIIEPGRFMAAPCARLVTRIIRIHDNNIVVNASVYNSELDALIVPIKLLVMGELKKGEGAPYVVKGITPCSMDLFRYKVYLKDPKEGDKLVFLNAGAYNFSSDFCDLEKLETEVVEDF